MAACLQKKNCNTLESRFSHTYGWRLQAEGVMEEHVRLSSGALACENCLYRYTLSTLRV